MILPVLLVLSAAAAAPSPATYPEIRADARYELFAMVQMLAGADRRFAGFHRHDIPYDRAAEAHFKPFARHPAVERYAELTAHGFTYVQAYQYLFALGDPPELSLRDEQLPEPLLALMGGRQGEEEFRLLLKDFAQASGFMRFYAESAPERERMVEDVQKQARSFDIPANLERYTGIPVKTRYTVIISPFAEPVESVSVAREDPDGAAHVTAVFGPDERKGRFGFRLPTRFSQFQRDIVLGELLARAEPHREALNRSSALFAPIADACGATWYDCVQRHIAFAVGARLLDRSGNHEMAALWPGKYARIGWPYLAPLVAALKDYEKDRARYPTLLDFYPKLIAVFDGLAAGAKKPPPFLGDIAKAMADPGPAVLIAPAGASPRLLARVDELRRRSWPRAERMTDRQALATNLSGKIIVVVGAMDGDAWLSRRWAALGLPARLDADGIVFAPRSGEKDGLRLVGRLGLVTDALNPDDPTRPAVVYTAPDEQTLESTLGGEPYPVDFAVLDGTTTVKLGTYEKSFLPWRPK